MPEHSFFKDFVALFSEMSTVTSVCLIVGLILIIIEFYQQSKGVIGVCGLILIAAAIGIRMIGGGTISMLFMMVFFVIAVCFISHLIMLNLQKKSWLTHSLTLAITEAEEEVRANYNFLINHEGIASTDINPKGHMMISDVNFLVVSSLPIKKGMKVKVTDVEDDKIFVKQITKTMTETLEEE